MQHLLIALSNVQGVDPGTWGKADQATMQRRKVVRVRRGAGAAEPAPAAAPAAAAEDNEQAAAANPFAGVSLTGAAAPAANPFAGVSLMAAAKVMFTTAPQQLCPLLECTCCTALLLHINPPSIQPCCNSQQLLNNIG